VCAIVIKGDYYYYYVLTCSNMPDPVLEAQLTTVLTGADAGLCPNPLNVTAGPEMLTRRSAVFVDLFDTSRYGTRY